MKILLISFESANDSINHAATILAHEIQELISSSSKTISLDGSTTGGENDSNSTSSSSIFPDNVEIVTHVLKCQFNNLTVLAAKLKIDVIQPDAILFVTADNSNIKKSKATIVRFHKTNNSNATNTDVKQYVGRGRYFSSSALDYSTAFI